MKTSSLGDVIHNLPVVSDIKRHFPNALIDWCVEESFAAIPRLHPGVGQIIPVALRRWRKQLFSVATWREIGRFRQIVRASSYDAIVDTQGLLKSAVLARQARGPLSGYAADSAREPIAARFYDRHFSIAKEQHAVARNRQLAAAALGYRLENAPDYGIAATPASFDWLPAARYVVFLTATSRDDKLWPEAYWQTLGQQLRGQGYTAVLPGGSSIERERATRLAAAIPGAIAAPPMNIPQLAALLAGSTAAIGVDTGLTHLAVGLKVPTVALYTATDPGLTGVLGAGFYRNLGGKAQTPSPQVVLAELQAVLD
ncbi:lipopolysaccharide heptosyltransferase I [Dechloromonas sp. A34]|uniref:lipopolysaccharide heptosyltransferase I n=1 Tax=Dechloromonas sp. A34 TaxID=447588 RepID=UPI002248F0E2|nr:lipopolysaccharide heptosyltransferase I [Dechloromonas sp. A34]